MGEVFDYTRVYTVLSPFFFVIGTQALQQTQTLIDTAALTRNGQVFAAQSPISHFSRTLDGLPAQKDQSISWSVQGYTDNADQQFLQVQCSGTVVLTCQRCMQDFDFDVDAVTTVLIVDNEQELDVDLDDPDAPERILGSTHLDVFELVEDELILNIPYVPRHTVCPDLLQALQPQDEEAEDKKPNPFAVLSQLKKS